MKKILILTVAIGMGAVSTYAQGLVSISAPIVTAFTVNGGITNKAPAGIDFELLYSTSTSGAILTANNLMNNPTALALWTDSGVLGTSGTGLGLGKITAAGSVAATGWTAPSGAVYDNQRSYVIVGWSTTIATTWAGLVNAINNQSMSDPTTWFGTTAVGQNVAGGGPSSLPQVNMWGNQTATPGFGLVGAQNGIWLTPAPEPATMALLGLGGVSLLLFRRRK